MRKSMSALAERLDQIGFERTRRAVAALALSPFVFLYLVVALNAPPGWAAAFGALGACYLVAFLAVSAEWFWGRWFATGLGWSGFIVSIASMVMIGQWSPVLAIYGLLHALVVFPLAGNKMAARYDLQETWRQRYRMDDLGVARLRKTVTSASASLPSLILWALAPKPDALWGFAPRLSVLGGVVALVLAVAGLRAVIRLRSWGILALGGAGVLVAVLGHLGTHAAVALDTLGPTPALPSANLALVFLAAAVVPFVVPTVRFLKRSA